MYGRPVQRGNPSARPRPAPDGQRGAALTSAKRRELYCPHHPAGARSATSGATVGDSIDSPSPKERVRRDERGGRHGLAPVPEPA